MTNTPANDGEFIAQRLTETKERMTGPVTNGDLPAIREGLVAQAERVHQEMLHERDTLRKLLSERDTKIAGLEAQLQIAELNVSQMHSRVESAMSVRDDAVARRSAVETVLGTMMAIGRAFDIKNEPLIREGGDYAESRNRDPSDVDGTIGIGGMR